MFTTGEFSKIARVSRRTLRHYREIGLFQPVQSDPENGYHYYSASQLPNLHRILALRDLGLSLDQIKRSVTEDVAPHEIRGMLQMKKADIEQTLRDELRRIRAIESRLELLEHGVPELDVVTKQVPAQAYYATTFDCYDVEHGQDVIREVMQGLPQQVNKRDLGQLVTIAQAEDFTLEGILVDIGFTLVGNAAPPQISLNGMAFSKRRLPAVNMMAAVVIEDDVEGWHKGTEAIGRWMEANSYQIGGYQREVWQQLPTPRQAPIVELQVPLRKRALPGGVTTLLS